MNTQLIDQITEALKVKFAEIEKELGVSIAIDGTIKYDDTTVNYKIVALKQKEGVSAEHAKFEHNLRSLVGHPAIPHIGKFIKAGNNFYKVIGLKTRRSNSKIIVQLYTAKGENSRCEIAVEGFEKQIKMNGTFDKPTFK